MDDQAARIAVVALVIGVIVAIRASSGRLLKRSTPDDQRKYRDLGNALLGVPKIILLLFFLYVTYAVFLAPDGAGSPRPGIGSEQVQQR
jgi:ABC-type arginine transport system permease subunit